MGQLIQHCQDGFGRYPHLACCGQMVIGVDRQEGGWRLWNWQALQSAHLQMTLPLDAACQRSFVHAEPERSWFWLVEEFPSGVRINQYDAISLTKVADEVWLPETKILETQTEFRPLKGTRSIPRVARGKFAESRSDFGQFL